jgi:hypothetical protein
MDRLEIIDTCTRTAWYADQRQGERLHDAFADQVRLDHTSHIGGDRRFDLPRARGLWRTTGLAMTAARGRRP